MSVFSVSRAQQKQRQIPWYADILEGYDKKIVKEVDSTNALAVRLLNDISRPTWIMAEKQTAGRGRRGRAWMDQRGNFAATLVLFPKEPLEVQALRSFLASLALYDAFVMLTGKDASFSLKWPNDVLLKARKVAGILLETQMNKFGRDVLLIGFGVNLLKAPEITDLEEGATGPVALFSETGLKIAPERFLETLMTSYARLEALFKAEGFASIRQSWTERASHIGEQITARLPDREITGLFDRIDEKGHLVIQTASGTQSVAAAEVYFGGV